MEANLRYFLERVVIVPASRWRTFCRFWVSRCINFLISDKLLCFIIQCESFNRYPFARLYQFAVEWSISQFHGQHRTRSSPQFDASINERRIYANEDGIAPACKYLFDLAGSLQMCMPLKLEFSTFVIPRVAAGYKLFMRNSSNFNVRGRARHVYDGGAQLTYWFSKLSL